MIIGICGVILSLCILTFAADIISAQVWLLLLFFNQFCLMFSDVPSDGYSVELGKLEKDELCGQILITGQRIRYYLYF